MIGDELLARIRVVRAELDEIGRLIRDRAQGRQLADLIERANDVEREVKKGSQND